MTTSTNTIEISDLSHFLTSRERGAEAYQQFQREIEAGEAIISLDGAEVVSASFLDGLLLRLSEHNHLDKVSFDTTNERLRARLQRLSADRGMKIYLYEKGHRKALIPKEVPSGFPSKFSTTKPDES